MIQANQLHELIDELDKILEEYETSASKARTSDADKNGGSTKFSGRDRSATIELENILSEAENNKRRSLNFGSVKSPILTKQQQIESDIRELQSSYSSPLVISPKLPSSPTNERFIAEGVSESVIERRYSLSRLKDARRNSSPIVMMEHLEEEIIRKEKEKKLKDSKDSQSSVDSIDSKSSVGSRGSREYKRDKKEKSFRKYSMDAPSAKEKEKEKEKSPLSRTASHASVNQPKMLSEAERKMKLLDQEKKELIRLQTKLEHKSKAKDPNESRIQTYQARIEKQQRIVGNLKDEIEQLRTNSPSLDSSSLRKSSF